MNRRRAGRRGGTGDMIVRLDKRQQPAARHQLLTNVVWPISNGALQGRCAQSQRRSERGHSEQTEVLKGCLLKGYFLLLFPCCFLNCISQGFSLFRVRERSILVNNKMVRIAGNTDTSVISTIIGSRDCHLCSKTSIYRTDNHISATNSVTHFLIVLIGNCHSACFVKINSCPMVTMIFHHCLHPR